ncbi:MAG: hypothetical protein APR55_04455 [Methanolinea sp. SDB]|nr:MAG: hypothetical protein APR55_04455 [Methanolinea sp. SDB]
MKDGTTDRFHATDEKYLSYAHNVLQKALDRGAVTPDDADLILHFIAEIQSTSASMSACRIFKLQSVLVYWRKFVPPFRTNTLNDLYVGIAELKKAKRANGQPYSQDTQGDYVKILRRFYFWLIENEYSTIPEKKIMKIKGPAANLMTKTAAQLLTEEEVRTMLTKCQNSRDRALIAMLYEGGFRISELGRLHWEQVKFTDWNATVNVSGKTGKGRFIPLVMSRAYLATWRNDYPLDPHGDAFVFLTETERKPLQYRGVAKQLGKIAKRAGIQKHVTPHIFRHSRITHLIQQGYQESVIKKMMWGNITTKMFATYAHLTDADIENEVAHKQGVKTGKTQKEKILEPRQCPKCYTINGPTQNFCGACGLPLTDSAEMQVRELKHVLENLPPEKIVEIVTRAVMENPTVA